MFDKTTNDYIQQDKVLQSDYKQYCDTSLLCDSDPLSFNEWLHCGISYEKVWDDNKQAFVQEMFDDLPF